MAEETKPADKKEGAKPRGRRPARGSNQRPHERRTFDSASWKPKTKLGLEVKEGKIKDVGEILDKGLNIMEAEIVDTLLPNLSTDLLFIGQSKGKFGGGQRRVFKQTQKKTQEGNKPKFSTYAVVGNEDGYVGVGQGKSKETVPAREKALRNAKLNLIKISRGCGSWECGCKQSHTVPFKVRGKCGSVIIELIPAPKGTGLCVESECSKILKLAGITDVWSRTRGQTGSKSNLVHACVVALKQLIGTKVKSDQIERMGITEGIKETVNKTNDDEATVENEQSE
ncbi:MAG: 30S ribosomal protein S5 [Candidatus Woesearchaeota archaeon]|nr:30S ribosomal protein S5 [Candidatus Woesearchaeota archaeon]